MTLGEFYEVIQGLPQPEFLYMCLAAIALLFILMLMVRRQPKHVVAYTTDSGRVMVSRSAIVELVQTSCEQLQDVSKPQVKIRVKGNTTHFEIRIKLLSGARLRRIEETLQSHLRKALTENLGIESLGRINIIAVGFKSGRIESSLPARNQMPPQIETVEAYDEEAEDSEAETEERSK